MRNNWLVSANKIRSTCHTIQYIDACPFTLLVKSANSISQLLAHENLRSYLYASYSLSSMHSQPQQNASAY